MATLQGTTTGTVSGATNIIGQDYLEADDTLTTNILTVDKFRIGYPYFTGSEFQTPFGALIHFDPNFFSYIYIGNPSTGAGLSLSRAHLTPEGVQYGTIDIGDSQLVCDSISVNNTSVISNLNASLCDGHNYAYYQSYNNLTNKPSVTLNLYGYLVGTASISNFNTGTYTLSCTRASMVVTTLWTGSTHDISSIYLDPAYNAIAVRFSDDTRLVSYIIGNTSVSSSHKFLGDSTVAMDYGTVYTRYAEFLIPSGASSNYYRIYCRARASTNSTTMYVTPIIGVYGIKYV
jgi:hypothetical protein